MTPSQDLFFLIQSLSFSENRHFSRFSRRHKKGKEHQSLQLYELIRKQNQYDESAIKAHFKGTAFGKNLAFPKSHLYAQVLRALQSCHYEKTQPARFRSDLNKIALLADRGLPEQALRILKKSLKKAVQFEQCRQVLDLLRWKRRLVIRLQAPDFGEEIQEIDAAEQKWESAYLAEQQAIRLHDDLYVTLQAFRLKNLDPVSAVLTDIKRKLDVLGDKGNLSFEAKVTSFRAYAHFYHLHQDFLKVHHAHQQEVEVWEAAPHQIKADPLRFVRTFGAWLNRKALIKDYGNLLPGIERLRAREDLGPTGKAKVFEITSNLELFYFLNTGRTKEAISLAPGIEQGLNKHKKWLTPAVQLAFYHNLCMIFWIAEQYGGALRWTNRILHFPKGEVRKDIRNFAHLLEKILHYELGHTQVLESWFRSFTYRRRRKGQIDRLEEMLLELIQGLSNEVYQEARKANFQSFGQKLTEYEKAPGVSRLGLTELRQWVERNL